MSAAAALMVGLLPAAAAACQSDPGSTQKQGARSQFVVVGGMRATRDIVHGPGTKLPDGFVVEKSSWRIGPVRPRGIQQYYSGIPVHDDGWQVELAAQGDPSVLLRAYARQALRHGYRLLRLPSGSVVQYRSCETRRPETICSLVMRSADRRPEDQFEVRYISRLPESRTDVPGTHLTIIVRRPQPVPVAYDPLKEGGTLVSSVPPISASQTKPSTIPMLDPARTGRAVFRRAGNEIKPLSIEPGSELVASPWPVDANAPSYGLLLKITGDPDAVTRRYARQMVRFLPYREAPRIRTGTEGGRGARLLETSAVNSGGDSYELTVVDGGRGNRWGWFETGYD